MWPVEIDEPCPVLADLGGGEVLDGDGEMVGDLPGSDGPEPAEAGQALEAALGVPARVVVVWDPPWTPDRIDPAAAAALGLRR